MLCRHVRVIDAAALQASKRRGVLEAVDGWQELGEAVLKMAGGRWLFKEDLFRLLQSSLLDCPSDA